MSHRVFGRGRYQTNERDMVLTKTRGGTIGTRLVVVVHGTAADGWYYGSPTTRHRDLNVIADRNLTVISADLGNPLKPDNWGNDRSIQGIDDVILWATNTLGCITDRVGIIGDSAGGATALGWCWRNPTRVGACLTRGGVTDVTYIYNTGNLILVPLINMAYDNTFLAQAPTHDPMLNTALCVPFRDRIQILYNVEDLLTPPSIQLGFADAVGCQAVPIGGGTHDNILDNVNGYREAQFIAERLAA